MAAVKGYIDMNSIASCTQKKVDRRATLLATVLLLFGTASGSALAESVFPAQGGVALQASFAPYQSLSNAELRQYRGGDLVDQSLTQVAAPRETMVAVQLWDELRKAGQGPRGIVGGNSGAASIPGQISSSDKISDQVRTMQNLVPIVPRKIAR